jgi:hypothetical protein
MSLDDNIGGTHLSSKQRLGNIAYNYVGAPLIDLAWSPFSSRAFDCVYKKSGKSINIRLTNAISSAIEGGTAIAAAFTIDPIFGWLVADAAFRNLQYMPRTYEAVGVLGGFPNAVSKVWNFGLAFYNEIYAGWADTEAKNQSQKELKDAQLRKRVEN